MEANLGLEAMTTGKARNLLLSSKEFQVVSARFGRGVAGGSVHSNQVDQFQSGTPKTGHVIVVDLKSVDRETKGLETKFPELRKFVKGSKGQVDYMLNVNSIKTSRRTEGTNITALYVLPTTKGEDGTKETRAVYYHPRGLPATAKINPAGKMKLKIRRFARLRNTPGIGANKTNGRSYVGLVKTLWSKVDIHKISVKVKKFQGDGKGSVVLTVDDGEEKIQSL